MSNYLTLTVDPTDSKLSRFIRRLHIWWLERKNPIKVGSIWKSKHFKRVDDYIIIAQMDDERVLYYYLDTYSILGNFLYCKMHKINLLSYWEKAEWQ